MDDEPMWAVDHVVAPTPGFAITIPETANEFTIKGSSNSDSDKIMARMDAMTMKMDAQYKKFQSRSKQPNPDHNETYVSRRRSQIHANLLLLVDKQFGRPSGSLPSNNQANPKDVLVGMPNNGKFLKELVSNKHKLEQISSAFLSDEISAIIQNKVPPKLGDPRSFLIPCNFGKAFSCNALADLGASINLMPYSLYAKLSLETLKPTKMSVRLADRSFQHLIGIAENMLVEVGRPFLHIADAVIRVKQKQLNLGVEEDFNALLDEGSKILHSIEGTILKEKLFTEFDEFMAMTFEGNSKSESDIEEPPFKKITFNTDYKIKTSLEEPPLYLE
ncbi:reverse transcriptase domain-containing protein [Tanacetum coccineum]|uniref:Reverse transcriptase domain-containing protein n=1 Tax=Tanacetum coccineum TaxID=301880 RepID=A0ABQ5DJY1_9ASTR